MNAQAATYTCVEPGCETPVAQPAGRWSRCTEHRLARERGGATAKSNGASEDAGFEERARGLVSVGRKVDRALARYRPAKSEAQDALAEWKATLRRLAGEEAPA
jgi:hypothetical protein